MRGLFRRKQSVATPARAREVAQLLVDLRQWAKTRSDIRAILLVGSWVNARATMSSDVDLVLLAVDPSEYLAPHDWLEEFGDYQVMLVREWGPVTEVRATSFSGLAIEFNFAPLSWAAVNPVDEGTYAVIRDGATVVHDPSGFAAHLLQACGP